MTNADVADTLKIAHAQKRFFIDEWDVRHYLAAAAILRETDNFKECIVTAAKVVVSDFINASLEGKQVNHFEGFLIPEHLLETVEEKAENDRIRDEHLAAVGVRD